MLAYDPAADRWYMLPPLPMALQGTVVQPWNNELIVTNGYDGVSGVTSSRTWIGQWPVVGTPAPRTSTSFNAVPFSTDQLIQAEDFDNGGEGIAYHDTTAANLGNSSYRAGTGVDIQNNPAGGYNVGYTTAGEWVQYTITVPTTGSYTLWASVAAAGSGASFHANFDGSLSTGPIAVSNSGSWSSFKTITSQPTILSAGVHVMRISLDQNITGLAAAGNFDWFQLNS